MKKEKNETGASWWREMLTRREVNGRLAKLGIASLLLGSASFSAGCGGDEEYDEEEGTEVQRDALDVQKELGWNAGSTETPLKFTAKTGTDSEGSVNWSTYLKSADLLKAYQPKNAQWQPYVVPTLLQSLDQTSLRGQLGPVHSKSMDEAYARGLGMKEILKKSDKPQGTLVVVDIPGPEAVAYAAALADVVDPIITFDNWPHPLGVVHSHETLGALLYYAGEVAKKAEKRPADAPGLLILDGNRLAAYSEGSDQFDNRYPAKIPTADKLSGMKVTNILYAVPDQSMANERDDLNEDFALFKDKGINVSMVNLSDFKPDPKEAVKASNTDSTGGTNRTAHHSTYYYGGGMMFMPWFFYHYPVYMGRGIPGRGSLPATNLTGRNYSPARRPTMFSGRNVGGGSGVGRARPSGFGRVSTRVGSNGRSTVGSSGRSGSYGRSRGGGYSG